MEESSVTHMETDVSSTTGDVLDMQEVTGSDGNVEMVVIVEKVTDETSTNSNSNNDSQTDQDIDNSNNVSTFQTSPVKDLQLQKCMKSPNKGQDCLNMLNKSPTKPEVLEVTPSDDIQPRKSVTSIQIVNSEETVDSSSKTDIQSPNKDIQKSLSKETEISPSNEIQRSPNKVTHISPIKETKKSPNKITLSLINKEVKLSPNKEILSSPHKDSPSSSNKECNTSQNKESQKTPVKEIQKTLIKSPVNRSEVQDTVPKTPIKIQTTEAIKIIPIKESISEKSKVNGKHDESDSNKGDDSYSNVTTVPVEVVIEKETPNDSQMDTNSDISEKDHNKSISRELKSLINSAKESKIISECTQLTSKTRKSRTALDTSNTSLNTSVEADKILNIRRSSDNSLKSNCSEKSDKTTVKRSMRSQNPEFVNKVKLFLNSVTKNHKDSDEGSDEETVEAKSKEHQSIASPSTPKRKKMVETDSQDKVNKLRSDTYCWRCHWAVEQPLTGHAPMQCTVCPRSFHFKCLSGAERNKIDTKKSWVCPECMAILHAESSETRSVAMKKISLGMLQELLKYALERMMELNGVEPFIQPVDRTAFPDYEKYVVHPMDLSKMKANITLGVYGSTEAFIADAQWILHNSIIFNTLQSKLTGGARGLVRSCRAEMGEIEACPECYAAHARRPTWFTDVCSTPHVLLWAKLKGFPYWPAKGMSVSNAGMVDVRFFGAHDRAWVPAKDCFLYSEKDPNNFRTKRQDILDSMQEAEQHIRNISRKYGKFVYPPFKTQFDPSKLYEQLKLMIPSFEGEVRATVKDKASNSSPSMVKDKSRSNSKSSKCSANEGDTSENEEALPARKMADGAEIARVDDDYSIEKDKTIEVTTPRSKEAETSRKRRRSDLEEAVITIMDPSKEKKKRGNEDKADNKSETQEPSSSKDIEMKSPDHKTKNGVEGTSKTTDNEPTTSVPSSTDKEKATLKVAPIKIITTPKGTKQTFKTSTPKEKDVDKSSTQKHKPAKVHKSLTNGKDRDSKDEKSRQEKRRNSRHSKSLNNSNTASGKTDKIRDTNGKKNDSIQTKENDTSNKSTDKTSKQNGVNSKAKIKDRLLFDDDTSLAIIAREVKSGNESQVSCLPTISSVRSLFTTAHSSSTTTISNSSNKTIEVTIEPTSDASVFTPTSTDGVRNMNEAITKLQKLRNNAEQPMVGRVGVRAFARMVSSPEKQTNNDVQVEIKAEPMDSDDAERQIEKMDLMNAFRLRPVNPPTSTEMRINRVVVTPVNARKGAAKATEVRPRAKKTFPVPRRTDEGRSELNGKNSMVYIPIQPPNTPGPAPRPPARTATPLTPAVRSKAITTVANNIMSTMTPLVPATGPLAAPATVPQPGPTMGPPVASSGALVPGVPTAVHTVPLITSVNGQWTFSLQPVMSVGGVEGTNSPPLVNGLPDRTAGVIMPLSAAAALAAASTSSASITPLPPSTPLNQLTTPVVPANVSSLATKTGGGSNDAGAKPGE
ncbi:LOW QUALITY PROTEIN: uncharacterized protein ACR2FA_012390, partial [Aphomia sociella]